jgi:predicted dithiol-disulfide oxidoreductase (DUF899 family)
MPVGPNDPRAEVARLTREIDELKRRRVEALRALPPQPVRDYELHTLQGAVRLSELFGGRHDLIVIHNMGRSCPYCTTWADGFVGLAKHLEDRAALVLSSPDEPKTQAEFAASRGWPFRMVSIRGTSFAKDMGFEDPDGDVGPGVSAFHRNEDGSIVRTGYAWFGPGDDFCGLWHMFDLLKDGAAGWAPKYQY